MPTLKFPLEVGEDGSLVTLQENTDQLFAQLLSVCAQTEPGTFPYTPSFGVFDPTFNGIDRGSFMIQASRFIPEVVITSIDGTVDEVAGNSVLRVSYRRT